MSIARRMDPHTVMHSGIAEQCRKSKMIDSLPALVSLRNRLRKKKKESQTQSSAFSAFISRLRSGKSDLWP